MISVDLIKQIKTPKNKSKVPELFTYDNETSIAAQKSNNEESWLNFISPSRKIEDKEQNFFQSLFTAFGSDDKEQGSIEKFKT